LHAVFRMDGGQWLLEDAGSTNGTFVGQDRVERIGITGPCQLRLGHPDDGPVVSCSVAAAPGGPASTELAATPPAQAQAQAAAAAAPLTPTPIAPPPRWASKGPSGVMPLPARALRIGRAPDNQVVVPDLGVSRYHAELRKTASGY